jgi:hypothetical protein
MGEEEAEKGLRLKIGFGVLGMGGFGDRERVFRVFIFVPERMDMSW